MSTTRRRMPIRRPKRQRGEDQRRRSNPRTYRPHWKRDLVEPPPDQVPPPYVSIDDVPRDLLERAYHKKLFVDRFVREGCPRGKLVEYAEQAAKAMKLGPDDVPPYTTLRGWVHRFRTWGLLGLVDRVRQAREKGPFERTLDTWIVAAVVGGRLTYAAARRLIKRLLPQGAWRPSESTVARRVKRYVAENPQVLQLAELGADGFRTRFRLAFPDHPLPPGLRFAIDTTPADLVARVPDLTDSTGWRLVRVFLTLILDEGSRRLLTFNLSLWPVDSQIMLGVLRRVVIPSANYPGLPTVPLPPEIRMDAGPEYLGGFRRTMEVMGVENYVGRTAEENGRIERLFRTIKDSALGGLPGFIPNHKVTTGYVKTDSEGRRKLSQLKYEPIRLSIPQSMVKTLPELEAHLHAWAVAYNRRAHSAFRSSDRALQGLRLIQQALHDPHSLEQEISR